jgi:hypothetical protein
LTLFTKERTFSLEIILEQERPWLLLSLFWRESEAEKRMMVRTFRVLKY